MCCLSACAPLRPNRAPYAESTVGVCVSHRSTIGRLPSGASASRSGAFREGCSACGGDAARGWHGRSAVLGAPPLRHRATSLLRAAPSIRECGLHGLVGEPPCALQRRLAAYAAPRRRLRSGPVAGTPRPLPAIRKESAQALPLAPLILCHACASHFIGTSSCRITSIHAPCSHLALQCYVLWVLSVLFVLSAIHMREAAAESPAFICAIHAPCSILAHPERASATNPSGAGEGRGEARRGRPARGMAFGAHEPSRRGLLSASV